MLIALQGRHRTARPCSRRRLFQGQCQRRRIPQGQVKTLTSYWVQGVRRIARNDNATAYLLPGTDTGKVPGAALAYRGQLPRPPADFPLQGTEKFSVIQAFEFSRLLRVCRPNQVVTFITRGVLG